MIPLCRRQCQARAPVDDDDDDDVATGPEMEEPLDVDDVAARGCSEDRCDLDSD